MNRPRLAFMILHAVLAMIPCAVAVAQSLAAAHGNARHDSASTELVSTDRGGLRGKVVGSVEQFLGVPYAAPPTGDRRWTAPAPAPRWTGVRDATERSNSCLQANDSTLPTNEDCLYLNVYRPAHMHPVHSLPVLVWIHGGSNKNGAGNLYDPSEWVSKTGIIVVTLNYRLNVFGFLALPSLDAEADDTSSGNYGLLDQQAALRWVHRNIAAFGGNAFNVTIAGHSAGAVDVCAHLVSPTAAGLFSKAILQSNECKSTSHAAALQNGEAIAAALGCADMTTSAACLRAKTATQLQTEGASTIGPNISGRVLPLSPDDAFLSGQWNHAPILLGSAHDEANGAVLAKVGYKLDINQYKRAVFFRFGSLAPAVLAEYKLEDYSDPAFAFAAENTDSRIACGMSRLTQQLSAITATFRYEFADPNPPAPMSWNIPADVPIGSYHGSELQYLFDVEKSESAPLSEAQRDLAARMMRYWANFAKRGNPNGPGLVRWPHDEFNTQHILSFRPAGDAVIDTFDEDHHCAFWGLAGAAARSSIKARSGELSASAAAR